MCVSSGGSVGVCVTVCLSGCVFVCDCLCVQGRQFATVYGLLKIIKLVYSDYVKNGLFKTAESKICAKIINELWALVCYIMDLTCCIIVSLSLEILKILHKICISYFLIYILKCPKK